MLNGCKSLRSVNVMVQFWHATWSNIWGYVYTDILQWSGILSVLKIRVHKQCHVKKFSTATSTCMLWTHRHVQSPSHTQRAVHWRAAFLHLQRLTHPFWHLQETSSMQLWAASGSLVQYGVYCPPVLTNPSWLVEGALVLAAVSDSTHVHLDTLPSWHVPLKLPSLEGSAAHCSSLQRVSSWPCQCPCICWFDHTTGSRTSRWCTLHRLVCHVVRRTAAAAPQWVLAVPSRLPAQSSCHVWQNWTQCRIQLERGTLAVHEPSLVPVQLLFRVLLGIGNFGLFQMPAIVRLLVATSVPRTLPAPVSTVRMTIEWCPCLAAWDACSNIRLSASSWLHGASEVRSGSSGLLSTASPSVMTSCLSSWSNHSMRAAERNLNSSVLLLSTHRKFCQFPGMAAVATTCLRTPCPCFARVLPFSESAK